MDQNRNRNEEMPNRKSNMEPAEGSRDTTMNRDRGGSDRERAGGITNRPLDREQEQQHRLPERGRSQSER
jgi:hypothetical protein